ncbi:MAG: penicillin-binding transpeptidase domain-containing protein, partial [Candidatus Omnitrophota bacterium]
MRTRAFSLILILCLLFLVSGLAYVQISRHEAYRIMSEDNRLKVIPLMAPRGCIYDRNGKAMVKDEISFNVAVIYSQIKDREALTEILSSILGLSGDEVRKGREKARRQPYTLTNIASDIGIEKAVHLEEVVMDHPGLLLDVSTKRRYLEKNAASNLLGYLGLINREEFEKLKPYGYRFDDLVGRDGIEKYYDQYLRGAHGGKQIEVDHMGREMTTLGYKEPVPGRDVYLTVDLELQRYCDELLEGKRGSIIAMDPRTGDVLAMASAPNYNPEIFTRSGNGSEVKKILRDKDYPLLNRAISGSYPLGSVFKIVVATGALETGKASRDKRFHCPGSFSLGRKTFRCWRKDGHGSQTMEEAIKNSCNVYFYQLGLLLGVDDISSFAGKLGMG